MRICSFFFAAFTAVCHGAEGSRPNVLFIMADDLRDAVGCYGHPLAKTPHIDRLAARGVKFQRAVVQYPVCNPSRTSLLSGLRVEETKVANNTLNFRDRLPAHVMLPQLFRGQGYRTVSFGKIYHVGEAAGEERSGWTDEGKSWDLARMFKAKDEGREGEIVALGGQRLKWCRIGQMEGGDELQPDGMTASAAIKEIRDLSAAGKQWFVAAGFHRPHDPFFSPKKYFDLYPKVNLPLYKDPASLTPAPPLAISKDWGAIMAAFTEDEQRTFLQGYLAGVSFMDAQVGRLLDALDRLKLWETTVVVFCGDHGYHLGERKYWNKNTLFDRVCRAPLIVAAPGCAAGQSCRALAEFIDIYPTVIELCGLSGPSSHKLTGKSLVPCLKDPTAAHKDAAYTMVVHGREHGSSALTDRYRFTHWSDGAEELYDHAADPQETANLAADPAAAGEVEKHRRCLAELPAWK